MPEFQRLREVTGSPIYSRPVQTGKLLPVGRDAFSQALYHTRPDWTVAGLTTVAHAEARQSGDISLLGLAALAKEPVVLAALHESVVLYAEFVCAGVPETVPEFVYVWEVDEDLAERAGQFVETFNDLFREDLPAPVPDNADRYWLARSFGTARSGLGQTDPLRPKTIEVPELLGDCVELELRAQRIYELLAERHRDNEPVSLFFATLAGQESTHAEMLELCRAIAGREGWMDEYFAPWRAAIPRLDALMDEVEASLEGMDSVEDALRLVIRVEGSEINQVFESVVAATDSDFVHSLQAFQSADEMHISYITDRIPEFEPALAGECADLKASFSGRAPPA
jgi:rubrerythrin